MKKFYHSLTELRRAISTLAKNQFAAILMLASISALISAAWMSEEIPVLYLAGDSTMADKLMDDNPEHGWGQVLPLFADPKLKIENHAKNGRSTKSFIDQGLWAALIAKVKPGDYVFIQFGHNDSKITDSTRYADAETTYKMNLTRFVNEVRSKNAFPVLLTPVNRRKFDSTGAFIDQHGKYPGVVRALASSLNVPLIDVHQKSMKLFQELGPEATKKIFLHISPGIYKTMPNGKEDNTHFSRSGAVKIARLVVEGINEINLPLKKYFNRTPEFSESGSNKIVGLDYYYNNEYKRDSSGHKYRYHYVWEDNEFSGFSVLGNLFENTGARVSQLCSAPEPDSLARLSVYIIVDPDTPAETEKPNYLAEPYISNIVNWVSGGGVLMLLANDSGNCEFKHLNDLARHFGLRFNEDRYNLVKGKDYLKGAFDGLPDHPLFKGVGKIYMKEICSIETDALSERILSRDSKVFIAGRKFGSGYVFVVGDPWLYNEYIDSRKIPSEYDNFTAATNLVNWIIGKASVPLR